MAGFNAQPHTKANSNQLHTRRVLSEQKSVVKHTKVYLSTMLSPYGDLYTLLTVSHWAENYQRIKNKILCMYLSSRRLGSEVIAARSILVSSN